MEEEGSFLTMGSTAARGKTKASFIRVIRTTNPRFLLDPRRFWKLIQALQGTKLQIVKSWSSGSRWAKETRKPEKKHSESQGPSVWRHGDRIWKEELTTDFADSTDEEKKKIRAIREIRGSFLRFRERPALLSPVQFLFFPWVAGSGLRQVLPWLFLFA